MFKADLSNLRFHIGDKPIDCFICSASFESRCRSITDRIDPQLVRMAYVAFNENLIDIVSQHLDHIHAYWHRKCSDMRLRSDDPILSATMMDQTLRDVFFGEPKRVIIDATTFTRESLLILLNIVFRLRRSGDELQFLYAHASEYSVGDVSSDKWLSKGVREVRSILGYPGKLLPSRRNHLIVLVGFENERALGLIRKYEPFKISLGIGDASEVGAESHHETNLRKLHTLTKSLNNVETFTFRAYDIEATRAAVDSQVSKRLEYNTIIAPMHTKISALSVGALALHRTEIQLCYAQVNMYNVMQYSTPGSSFYSFTLEDLFSFEDSGGP